MKVHGYKDLIVWQKAVDLALLVYELTSEFPVDEKFGLTSQMRRCSISISANIAEGRRRGTARDYRRFLQISYGSGAELETYFIFTRKLKYGNKLKLDECECLHNEVMRMLNKMIGNLRVA